MTSALTTAAEEVDKKIRGYNWFCKAPVTLLILDNFG